MDINVLHEIKCCLERIETSLSSDDYEKGPIFSVGGASGNYIMRSPYNTEAEFSVVGAFAQGVSASGIIYVSSSNPGISGLSSTPPTLGLQSNGEESNVFDGYVLPVTTQQAPFLNEYWQPLGRGINLYINAAMASGNGYVLVAFRRSLNHTIPDMPKERAHTHTPISRHALRTMPAQSPMVAGFENQYPRGAPYQHMDIPEQDTSNLKHADLSNPKGLRQYQGTGRRRNGR